MEHGLDQFGHVKTAPESREHTAPPQAFFQLIPGLVACDGVLDQHQHFDVMGLLLGLEASVNTSFLMLATPATIWAPRLGSFVGLASPLDKEMNLTALR